MEKKITLIVEDQRMRGGSFKVAKITNSVEWSIWQILSVDEINAILERGITVQIVEPKFN